MLKPAGFLPKMVLQRVKRRRIENVSLEQLADGAICQLFQHYIEMVF